MSGCPVKALTVPGRPMVGRFPVPYVAMWASEAFSERIGMCPHDRRPAVVCDESPDGLIHADMPIFGRMHPVRQRECVLKRLCSVCGRRIHTDPVTREIGYLPWFTSDRDQAGASIHGAIANGEPMTCARCCVVSLALCPGLGRMKDSLAGLLVMRVRAHGVISARMSVEPGVTIDADVPRCGDGTVATADGRVQGMLKIQPLRYRAEFAEAFIESMRRRGIA